MNEDPSVRAGMLRIGAVARLTGLTAHTIRKWEERHQAVTPRRTDSGERLYRDDDVDRLILIKRLSDEGLYLRDLARASTDELRDRAARLAARPSTSGDGSRPRLAFLGTALAELLSGSPGGLQGVDEVGRSDDPADLEAFARRGGLDVLVVDSPAVLPDTMPRIQRLRQSAGAAAAVVVYRYGARADVEGMSSDPVTAIRAPVDAAALERAVASVLDSAVAGRASTTATAAPVRSDPPVPPPRLPRAALARLANANTGVGCECQRQLSDIASSLLAFEDYSKACESRSPADRELHAYLAQMSGRARLIFEEVIERFAEVEGIRLDG